MNGDDRREVVFVGSSRRRYMIDAKLLNHPLLNALIDKSKHKSGDISVKCEVVIFDHLLWMLQNADPDLTMDSLEELAQLYAYWSTIMQHVQAQLNVLSRLFFDEESDDFPLIDIINVFVSIHILRDSN